MVLMVKAKEQLTSADYVHLHNHTQYSLLDGLTKVPELIDYIKAQNMTAVAITDHGTMSGAIEFYKTAIENQIKPIIGMEAYVASRGHLDKDSQKDKQIYHLTMLAINEVGYKNLMRLSTIANLDGFYYKPRIDRELIEKYSQGLIVLSGCLGGELADALNQDQYQKALEIAKWYKQVFGDRYYIELQDHGHKDHPSNFKEQEKVNQLLLRLADELKIKPVVTCDAHYLKKSDKEAHEVLLCVQTAALLSDKSRMSLKDFDLNVAEPKEIIKRWGKERPELITNSRVIAERCSLKIELGKILIPNFPLSKGETERSRLRKIVWQGLLRRYLDFSPEKAEKVTEAEARKKLPQTIVERADFELGVIDKMNFNGYFLIVSDFINWGKDRGIVFGPGRGSAAGSIVAYATRITNLDPLSYDLLFERFLNPDRISMPDMDIDIQDSRRDEVINYCIEKYGRDRVANIVTFGRMAARNAVRDVARVLEMPYAEADRIAKLIPPPIQGRHLPLRKSLENVPELKDENQSNPKAKRVFELASRLEMTIRSHGVHAAGVVIAPDDIVNYTPLEMAQKGVIATQYSMWPIEDLGLLKMDFLGLSNLTTIKNSLRIVKKVYQQDVDIDAIALDDEKTFELLQRGETTGVFQLESAGMRRYLKDLKPTVFDDIVAMGALYRPGPMQWIDEFIARKHGIKAIEYLHPSMEPALNNTYGIIVYQEQVMQIAKEMCGFSGGQADTLRKAIGKKIPEVMAKMKDAFIEGGIKHSGAERQLMEKFWQQLEDFAAYCFNKSHAACYGLIAYQTAYLKAHYPAAFMAALMTSDYDNTDRLAIEITECKHMGIEVLPPDINQSFHEFAVVPGKDQIRFGLDAVKNVGSGAVEEIILAREKLKGFNNLESFFSSVNLRLVNRKTIESLIKAGAFDSLENRGKMLFNIDQLMAFGSKIQKEQSLGQTDLFGGTLSGSASILSLNESPESVGSREMLSWERELLGLYLSHHPLEDFETILSDLAVPTSRILPELEGQNATLGGSLISIREITTKNNSKMAFVRIADSEGEVELVIFPSIYKDVAPLLQRDTVVLAKGKISAKGSNGTTSNEPKLLVDELREISQSEAENYQPGQTSTKNDITRSVPNSSPARVYIRLNNGEDSEQLLALKKQLDNRQGDTEVVLVTGPATKKQAIRLPQKIVADEPAIDSLAEIFGQRNVVLR